MNLALGMAILVQIWLLLTNLIAIYIFAENSFETINKLDEVVLILLSLVKIIFAPIVIGLTLANRDKGIKLFLILCVVYSVGIVVMPALSMSFEPMAWWYNTRHMGQGPLYLLIYLGVGGFLFWKYLNESPQIKSRT